jgi:hypothetical protein
MNDCWCPWPLQWMRGGTNGRNLFGDHMSTFRISFPVRVIVAVLCFWMPYGSADTCQQVPYKSCFNQLGINPDGDWSEYNFVAFGHIRSAPGIHVPNQVLRTHVQRLSDEYPAFVISLGDLYYNVTEEGLAGIKVWVRDNIPAPFFNAAGNHDTLMGGDLLPDGTKTPTSHNPSRYIAEFGDPTYHFQLGSDLFLFIDTGRSPILRGEPWEQVKGVLAAAAADESIKNIFLFSHKVFWSYNNDNPAMAALFQYRHPIQPPPNYRFFLDELKPLLQPLAESKNIFLFAGDIGGGASYLQTFFLQEPDITYVATGMGNTPRDSFLNVSVKSGVVSLENINFTTGERTAMENYGPKYWESFYRENPGLAAQASQADKGGAVKKVREPKPVGKPK